MNKERGGEKEIYWSEEVSKKYSEPPCRSKGQNYFLVPVEGAPAHLHFGFWIPEL